MASPIGQSSYDRLTKALESAKTLDRNDSFYWSKSTGTVKVYKPSRLAMGAWSPASYKQDALSKIESLIQETITELAQAAPQEANSKLERLKSINLYSGGMRDLEPVAGEIQGLGDAILAKRKAGEEQPDLHM